MRRWRQRYEEHGADGLIDRRVDRPSPKEERRVGHDHCVRWHGRSLRIPPTPLRPHLVRATVRVHDYPDGTLAIFKGPQRLASFPAGRLCGA